MDYQNDPHNNEANPDHSDHSSPKEGLGVGVARVVEHDKAQPNNRTPSKPPKPPPIARIWRTAWRRRTIWRSIAGHPKANWAEKTTVTISICVVIVAGIQAYIYQRQANLMSQSINQNERTIILNMGQLALGARSAKAAEDSADIARKALDASTRPWVDTEITAVGPITFDSRGAQIPFVVTATNFGSSPAQGVDIRVRILNSQSPDVIGEQERLCPPKQNQPGSAAECGRTVFPGEQRALIQRFSLTMDKAEMDKSQSFIGAARKVLIPTIIACVDYIVIGRGEHHQSYAAGSVEDIQRDVNIPTVRWFRNSHLMAPSN